MGVLGQGGWGGFLGVLRGRVGWTEGEAGLWHSLKTSGLQSVPGLRKVIWVIGHLIGQSHGLKRAINQQVSSEEARPRRGTSNSWENRHYTTFLFL